MQKIVDVFDGSAQRRKGEIHPTDAIVGIGRVRRGLGKGGESCWRGQQRRALWRGRDVSQWKLHHGVVQFTVF